MGKKFRALVVDDEPDKRALLAFALENEGYEVHTADDGLSGLSAVDLYQPDLIVTDVMMPRMDGYEMVRRIRSNPQTKFIPVIIQSAARNQARDERFGSELGALGYITDPTDLDLLRARARTLLEFKQYIDMVSEAFREREKAFERREREVDKKRAEGTFDIFLCHNSKDKEAVKDIAIELGRRGILAWLDEWELRPGHSWQDALESQIGKIKAAAVFVGENGIGPWQKRELDAFLREFVARSCPVIPVLLPNAPEKPALPTFLEGMTWVDFRRGTPNPIEQLYWGITGKQWWDHDSIGSGLGSAAKIVGGYIRYEHNNWGQPSLNLNVPVADGMIERDEDGKLKAFVKAIHPVQSTQQMLEKFGFDSFDLKSEDTVGSTDPAKPTVFTASRRMVIHAGEKVLDPTSGQEASLPVDLVIDTQTSVSGVLNGRRFAGSFTVVGKYSLPIPTLETSGTFEVHLS
jgi:CheY-like chemotaxis protein